MSCAGFVGAGRGFARYLGDRTGRGRDLIGLCPLRLFNVVSARPGQVIPFVHEQETAFMLASTATTATDVIVIGGVDTHADTHHAAVIDIHGRHLADQAFPATVDGYQQLLDWVAGHGVIDMIGVELTSSYGAGLTRYLTAAGVTVREVNTTDKATRARRGKTDQADAYAAAEKTLAGMATAIPKDTTGNSEAIRVLTLARDSAVTSRTKTWNQLRALLVTAPAALRDQLRHLTPAKLRTTITALTIPEDADTVTRATITALHRLATRITTLDAEIRAADTDLTTLVTVTAPTLASRPGIGTHTAARLLICVADNGSRIHSEAALAALTGVCPIPASSGKTTRMRLNRGGDRKANSALHMIAVGRLRHDPTTRAYRDKTHARGHSTRDAIRSLKRAIAREVYNALKTDRIIT
jgi:transposase